jgi:Tol biopolymer transport system component
VKRKLFSLAVAATVALCNTGCGSGSSPDPNSNGGGGSGRKIAYSATVDGKKDIYLMNPDGSGQTRVTTDGTGGDFVALSPDGSRVAFLRGTRLFVASTAGGGPQEIPVTLDAPGAPRWVANGNGLVLSSNQRSSDGLGFRSALFRVGLDGSSQEIKPAGRPELVGFNPDASPDGNKIVFTGLEGGSFRIWTMDMEGNNPQKIEATNWQSEPRFSPDGKQIVFHQHRSSGTARDLYIASVDGSNTRLVVQDNPVTKTPSSVSWSPDGKRIIYTASGGFFSIKTDGTDNTALTPDLGGSATLGFISWK